MVNAARWLAVTVCVAAVAGRTAQAQAARGLTVDDVLRLEELNAVVPSPDGKYVAIEVARPMSDVARVHTTSFDSRPRRDIWIVRLSDGEKQQLTDGSATGSGWFDPVWSPDGTRLAMLSTDGCNCIRTWTYHLGDRAPRLLDPRNVDYWVFSTVGLGDTGLQPLAWLDRTTLLVPLLPAGERTHVDVVAEAESVTIAGWQTQRAGKVSTASVLESVPGQMQPYLGDESIVAMDVERRSAQVVAKIPRDPTTSGRRSIVVSPNHRTLAVLTSRLEAPSAIRPLTRTMSHYVLGFVDATGRDTVRWVAEIADPGPPSEDMPIPTWTPNGDAVVVWGRWHTGERWQLGVWRIDARSGRVAPSHSCHIAMTNCSAAQAANGAGWVLVADTGLFRVDSRDGQLVDLLPPSLRRPTLHLTQLGPAGDARGAPCVIATLDNGNGHVIAYRVNVATDTTSAHSLGVLPLDYHLYGCVPHADAVFLERRDRALAKLEAGRLATLIEINAWSDSIAEPRKVLLHYEASDGAPLSGLLLLPALRPGVPDGPYPLILWVYAGMTFGDTAAMRADHAWSSPYNMALATAQGYAVLYPSIPLAPQGSDGPVAPHLAGAVLPAIDRVGSLGVIDTSRVAVMGQSFGGWTTLALITRTKRFRSAIALAAVSDQVSYVGAFRPWDRPWPYAHTLMAPEKMTEAGQQSLEGPLWQYPERYIEDSPVLQANRVGTPTMIIQGDQDFEGIQQSEEFFNALYRLGKRAEFVRYFGDTHAIESPANVRDMWQRFAIWLGATLRNEPTRKLGLQGLQFAAPGDDDTTADP